MIEELQRRPRILAIWDEWDEERLQERIREALRRVSGIGVGPYTTEGVRRVLGHPETESEPSPKVLNFPPSTR